MTKKEFAALCCKIFALYICIQTIFPLVTFLNEVFHQSSLGIPFEGLSIIPEFFFTSIVFPLVIAGLLWQRADWFSQKLIRQKQQDTSMHASTIELQTILISFVGFVLFVPSLLSLIFNCFYFIFFYFFPPDFQPDFKYVADFPAALSGSIVPASQTIIGVLIVLKARRIAHFLQKITKG